MCEGLSSHTVFGLGHGPLPCLLHAAVASRATHSLTLVSLPSPACYVQLVRHEDVLTPYQSKVWVASLIAAYDLPTAGVKVQSVTEYKLSDVSQKSDARVH